MKNINTGNISLTNNICLGAMYLGSKTDKLTSEKILDTFTENGGSFIDSANIYAHWITGCKGGDSEAFLGEWIRKRKNRDKLFIATKVGIAYPGVERGLKANQVKTECEKSLKRLGVETIDLYYSHADDPATPLEETLKAFDELIKEGKIRGIGASNYNTERFKKSLMISRQNSFAEFCCIQQRHSYLRPTKDFKFETQVLADEFLMELCKYENIALLAYSPLLSGIFTSDNKTLPQFYNTEQNRGRLKILKNISGETNFTVNQIVLAWMLNSEPPVIPVIGVSSLEQLEENLKAVEIKLDENHKKILDHYFYHR